MKTLLLGVCLAAAAAAQADDLNGQIAFHNDVVRHTITLDHAATLTAWTDSYQLGLNFDPMLALWHDGSLVIFRDDDISIAPGQTGYDTGFILSQLAAGDYLFTLSAFDNVPRSAQLADGYVFDQEAPIPLADWCEPASHCGMGGQFSLHWTIAQSLPEPGQWGMLAAGLGLLALRRRWRSARG